MPFALLSLGPKLKLVQLREEEVEEVEVEEEEEEEGWRMGADDGVIKAGVAGVVTEVEGAVVVAAK